MPSDVMGRAEAAVREWLTTGEFDSANRPAAASADRTAARLSVLWTSAVGGRLVDQDYWAVTVAADVLATEAEAADADEETQGSAASTRWLLEVGVLRSGGAVAVVGPPAVVSDPPSPEVDLRGTEETPQRDDPIATTAEAFLRSLLTGAGEVGRYMAPGSSVPPLTPAPFESVTVERIGIVRAGRATSTIRVEASAITAAEVEVSLSYELTMAERDGRWEVQGLSGAPTLRRDGRPEPGDSGTEPDGHGTGARPEPAPDPSTTNPPTPGA
ncbi:MAG TPA: conjugal transfer protein [Candidatus Limnocylindria bacterium]